ncbi:MAG: hypothetical protein JSS66_16640 [Armatimonadetes bacterium]|nr:hypothetical protein [Armatimonadota bacterium]
MPKLTSFYDKPEGDREPFDYELLSRSTGPLPSLRALLNGPGGGIATVSISALVPYGMDFAPVLCSKESIQEAVQIKITFGMDTIGIGDRWFKLEAIRKRDEGAILVAFAGPYAEGSASRHESDEIWCGKHQAGYGVYVGSTLVVTTHYPWKDADRTRGLIVGLRLHMSEIPKERLELCLMSAAALYCIHRTYYEPRY